jgi:hypothetical protein
MCGSKKKKKIPKKKQIMSQQQDEEEVGYMQKKSSALSMWYLPIIGGLWAMFRNPEDAKLMSQHASSDRMKHNGKLRHPSNGKQWKDFNAMFPCLAKRYRMLGSH